MKRRMLAVLGLLIAICVTGCASIPHQQFNKAANLDIRKIALLPIVEPREIAVVNLGGAASAFGIIGELAGSADESSKSKQLTSALDGGLVLGEHLTSALKGGLERDGYAVTYLDGQYPTMKDDEPVYSNIKTDADAILDVSFIRSSYISQPGSSDYTPFLCVQARLISVRSKTRLYVQQLTYGPGKSADNSSADPVYAYPTFDALMDSLQAAGEGLRAGVEPIAARFAKDLR